MAGKGNLRSCTIPGNETGRACFFLDTACWNKAKDKESSRRVVVYDDIVYRAFATRYVQYNGPECECATRSGKKQKMEGGCDVSRFEASHLHDSLIANTLNWSAFNILFSRSKRHESRILKVEDQEYYVQCTLVDRCHDKSQTNCTASR
jgi:hypothetical protein